jgi:hypothetical protein
MVRRYMAQGWLVMGLLLPGSPLLGGCGSTVSVEDGSGGAPAHGSGAGEPNGSSSDSGSSDSSGPTTGSGSGTSGSGSGQSGQTGPGSSGVGATGVGSTGASSGSGGTPDSWCGDCAEGAIDNNCGPAWDQCNASFACAQLLSCYQSCEFTTDCVLDCNAIIPSGVPVMANLMVCVVCVSCSVPCANTSLTVFCN